MMIKVAYVLVFLFCFIIDVDAQFNTIYRSNLQKNETITEKNEPVENDEQEKVENGFLKWRVFAKISSLFKNKKDSVPTDPTLFSYDKPEDDGFFIFTEEQEKMYLDSLKKELIKKRRDVLVKRSMMSLPMDTLQITSHFGYRSDPFTGQKKFHNGIDFRARNNFVYPILPGIVNQAGFRGGYGYCVEIKHGELTTLYAHLSYILVKEKQVVPAGEPIGISGTTGRSTGEHLHFSVIQHGTFINPSIVLEYIQGELADKNLVKEEVTRGKLVIEQDLEKEKKVLESLQSTEQPANEVNGTASVIFGGSNGRNGRGGFKFSTSDPDSVPMSSATNVIENGKSGSIVMTRHKVQEDTGAKFEKVKNENGSIQIQSTTDKPLVLLPDSVKTKSVVKGGTRKKEITRSNTGTRIVFRNTRGDSVVHKRDAPI